ncbi:MAG: UvrD-helicase domain-containing protein [bacterium]
MKYTKEQERIFHFIKTRPENILIEAYAGTGKTTTIVNASNLIDKSKKIVFLAFNKHIQKELKEKLPEHIKCYTTYGLGYSAVMRKYPDIKFDEYKVDKLIQKKSKSWNLDKEFSDYEERQFYLKQLKKLVNHCRLTVTLDKKFIPYLSDRHDLNLKRPEDIKRTLKVLDVLITDRKTMDFIDMIFLPAIDKGIWMFQYDYVLVDEVQDFNRAQIRIVEKILKRDRKFGNVLGRLIAVGDKNQCQPKGTKILLANGEYKNIEEINIGDKVVSYDRHTKGQFVGYYGEHRWDKNIMSKYGYNVNKVVKRHYNGNLIKIKINDNITRYTPEHKCMVRIKPNTVGKFMLYLMQKGNNFRIGINPIWSKGKINFGTFRARQENADKMWVLKIYENRIDAYLDEQYYSLKYSIPQLRFFHRDQKGIIDQKIIDNFYLRFKENELKNNAINLLNDFKRNLDYPIWTKGDKNYISKNHMFEMVACNIIPEMVEMIIFNKKNIREQVKCNGVKVYKRYPEYKSIDDFSYEEYNDFVFSLEINKHELYVADNILTHNSIYGFNSSDDKSFEWFRNFKNTKTLPLSTSFRCSKNIIQLAQKLVPEIQALDNAPDGVVREGSVLKEAKSGDLVLCRTTIPLIRLFFHFLLKKKKAFIRGADIGENLIELIGDIGTIPDLIKHWEYELEVKRNQLYKMGVLNPSEDATFSNLEDKVSTLLFLAKASKNIIDLTQNIKRIFLDDKDADGIILSTIHKAKGSESNRVIIVRKDLLPMSNVRGWQYGQELNLEYIAYTRAKQELIIDYDWSDEEDNN